VKKHIGKIAAALIVCGLLVTAGYYLYFPHHTTCTNERILTFDDARDTQEIIDIFEKDRYWLTAVENDTIAFKLKNRTPSTDPRYFGSLHIKVLYEECKFAGFIAYYMQNFFVGRILFLDVKPEFRGKGLAQELVRYAVDDLKRLGATMITLVTRTTNHAAQAVYKKVGFTISYEEEGFVYFELKA
jgi:ribosomal protein S18 acetylase RimI-like enzyme